MAKKHPRPTLQIELTPEQQEQIRQATGRDARAVKLAPEALDERMAPEVLDQ